MVPSICAPQARQVPDEVREWLEVRAIAAYVWSLNNGDFLPRRGGS